MWPWPSPATSRSRLVRSRPWAASSARAVSPSSKAGRPPRCDRRARPPSGTSSSTQYGGGVAEMLRLLVGYAETSGRRHALGRRRRRPGVLRHHQATPQPAARSRRRRRCAGAPGGGALQRRPPSQRRRTGRADPQERRGVPARPPDGGAGDPPAQARRAGRLAVPHRGGPRQRLHRRGLGISQAAPGRVPHLRVLAPGVRAAELAGADVWIISPSIDPTSPKNAPMPKARVAALLARIGLLEGPSVGGPSAVLGGVGPSPSEVPLVVQVSRWDRLKDMQGVMVGFADAGGGSHRPPASPWSGPRSTACRTTRRGSRCSASASTRGRRSRPPPATPSGSSRSPWTTSWRTRGWSTPFSATRASWCRRACRRASGSPSPRPCGSPARWWPRRSAASSGRCRRARAS